MQKRTKPSIRTRAGAIRLDPDFPISAIHPGLLGDLPITTLYTYPCLEIGYCHEGSGICMVENKVFPFSAGDVTIVDEHEHRYSQSVPKTRSRWTWLNLDPALLLVGFPGAEARLTDTAALGGPNFVNVLSGARHAGVAATARELIRETTEAKPGHRSAVRGLAAALLAQLPRLPGQRKKPAADSAKTKTARRIQPALVSIARNYRNKLSVDALARECRTSARNFRRVFQAATGRLPLDYLTAYRLNMAGALLRSTDKRVLDISLEVGFQTLSSFNRSFMRFFKTSPRKYRTSEASR
jgi:AraC-like DNA-binding protein